MSNAHILTPRIHILGANGQLAHALLNTLPDSYDTSHRLATYTRDECDFTDPYSFTPNAPALDLHTGDIVINCAAYTAVDRAETHHDEAQQVNTDAPAALATLCASHAAHLIHISTDYVFSGEDIGRPWETTDPTEPATVYGATKAAGEAAILQACPSAVIIRTAWLFTGPQRFAWGMTTDDFVTTIQKRYKSNGGVLRVVNDQFGSPTYSMDLARGIWEIVGQFLQGEELPQILHATNAGTTTWFAFATEIVGLSGGRRGGVSPCSSVDYPTPAPRPHWSVLSAASWENAGLTPLRNWKKALREALSEPADSLAQVEKPQLDS